MKQVCNSPEEKRWIVSCISLLASPPNWNTPAVSNDAPVAGIGTIGCSTNHHLVNSHDVCNRTPR